ENGDTGKLFGFAIEAATRRGGHTDMVALRQPLREQANVSRVPAAVAAVEVGVEDIQKWLQAIIKICDLLINSCLIHIIARTKAILPIRKGRNSSSAAATEATGFMRPPCQPRVKN